MMPRSNEPKFQLPPQVADELARLVWLAMHEESEQDRQVAA